MKEMLHLWELYQTLKNGDSFEEDTSYKYILTTIHEENIPKKEKQLMDEFNKI
jgi:hypothetical protein